MKLSNIYWIHEPILYDVDFSRSGHVLGEGANRLVPVLTTEDLHESLKNDDICGIILSNCLELPDITQKVVIISNKPMDLATQIRDEIETTHSLFPTKIHPSACIHPTAIIPEYDVQIGQNVRISEHVCIEQGCNIGSGTVIGPHSHIGMVPSGHSIHPTGKVIIGKEVSIHALCIIERPIFSDITFIGDRTHIDNRVFIHQGVKIGELSLITANTEIEEYSHIGRNCWVGLRTRIQRGVTIGNNCYVTLGSTITRNIKDNMVVRDNWEISRKRFRGIIP